MGTHNKRHYLLAKAKCFYQDCFNLTDDLYTYHFSSSKNYFKQRGLECCRRIRADAAGKEKQLTGADAAVVHALRGRSSRPPLSMRRGGRSSRPPPSMHRGGGARGPRRPCAGRAGAGLGHAAAGLNRRPPEISPAVGTSRSRRGLPVACDGGACLQERGSSVACGGGMRRRRRRRCRGRIRGRGGRARVWGGGDV
jgi:hypothetical protein